MIVCSSQTMPKIVRNLIEISVKLEVSGEAENPYETTQKLPQIALVIIFLDGFIPKFLLATKTKVYRRDPNTGKPIVD